MDYLFLDKTKSTSMTYQIISSIKTAILNGQLADQTQLATEKEISDFFNISMGIVKLAYSRLEQEGLVVRIKGKGTFVVHRPQLKLDLLNFDPKHERPNTSTRIQPILSEIETPDQFNLPGNRILPSTQILHQVYVHYETSYPSVLVHTYLAIDFLSKKMNPQMHALRLLPNNEQAQKVCQRHEHVMYARAADGAIAAFLKLNVNDPTSVIDRFSYCDEQLMLIEQYLYPGAYVELTREIYPHD